MCNKNLRHALELLLAPQRSPAVLPLTNNITTTIACDQRARNPCMFPAEPIQTKTWSKTRPIFPIDKTWTLTKPKINKISFFALGSERNPAGKMGLEGRLGATKMACDALICYRRGCWNNCLLGKVFCCFIKPPAVSEGERIDEYFKFGSSWTHLVGMYSIVNWFLEGKVPRNKY